MALKLSLNPGTFVCVELFVEFLILILRLLLDWQWMGFLSEAEQKS